MTREACVKVQCVWKIQLERHHIVKIMKTQPQFAPRFNIFSFPQFAPRFSFNLPINLCSKRVLYSCFLTRGPITICLLMTTSFSWGPELSLTGWMRSGERSLSEEVTLERNEEGAGQEDLGEEQREQAAAKPRGLLEEQPRWKADHGGEL